MLNGIQGSLCNCSTFFGCLLGQVDVLAVDIGHGIFSAIDKNGEVEEKSSRINGSKLRLGFVLGGMSGPGSGAHSRMVSLLEALSNQDVEIFVHGTPLQLTGLPKSSNISWRSTRNSSRLMRHLKTGPAARQLVRENRLDFVQFETLPVPKFIRCKVLFSIHHLVPCPNISALSPKDWISQSLWLKGTRRAAARSYRVVTLTQWSKDEIVSRLGLPEEQVRAIPFSWKTQVDNPGKIAAKIHDLHFGRFVLALGHLEQRKNLEVLIRACASPRWPPDVSLVLAGKDQGHGNYLQQLALESGARVFFTGAVEESYKGLLLSNALCLAMPSVLEGFGIPVIEAIAVGTPALVSDRTALPEVVGIPEAVLNATDPSEWARAVDEIARSDQQRSLLLHKEQRTLTRYSEKYASETYLRDLSSERQNIITTCDILHLAFGGLGGHRAVVEEISKTLSVTPLVSFALLLASKDQQQEWVHSNGITRIDKVFVKRRADISSMLSVCKMVYRSKPSVIVAHTHRHIPAAWLGSILSLRRPRIVLVEHQPLQLRTISDNINSLIGILFSKAIVFLTKTYQIQYPLKWLQTVLRKQAAIIPNGIEIPEIQKIWTEEEKSTIVIGMASRLIPQKDISNLIRAVAILNQHADFRLRIAGEGPDKERLLSIVASQGIKEKVRFDGELDRSLMTDWYLSLDLYAQVSNGETMSMSVVEAASIGLPIFSSDSPGIHDVFGNDKAAVIFERNEAAEIASAILRVVSLDQLKLFGSQARSVVTDLFSSRSMTQSYLDLFIRIGAIREGPNFLVGPRVDVDSQ